MSGGIAYVYDADGSFPKRCNLAMVDLEPVEDPEAADELKRMIRNHFAFTGSPVAARLLQEWDASLTRFVRVMPREYRRYLETQAARSAAETAAADEIVEASAVVEKS